MKSREFYNASFAIAGQAFILFLARALFFSNPPPRRFCLSHVLATVPQESRQAEFFLVHQILAQVKPFQINIFKALENQSSQTSMALEKFARETAKPTRK